MHISYHWFQIADSHKYTHLHINLFSSYKYGSVTGINYIHLTTYTYIRIRRIHITHNEYFMIIHERRSDSVQHANTQYAGNVLGNWILFIRPITVCMLTW